MTRRRVVVTGGAGFLGSHVVRLLLAADNEVVVLDDFSNGKAWHLDAVRADPRLRIERGDVRDAAVVRRAFQGCRLVFHLAVLDLRRSIKEPRLVSQVIVDGTLNCLEAAREHGIDRFVNCSSSEVYGSARVVPMNEEHPLAPETPYAAAKVAQDMYVASWGRTYGLPWTTLRPFNMYGPNSHWQGARGELIPKLIVRAMNHQPLVLFGDGGQTRDFVYVEEAAHALLLAAEHPACVGETLNFCAGVETPIRRIAELVCGHFGLDPESAITYQPARTGDVRRHRGDNTRFRARFGSGPPISIEEGLARTVDWFRALPTTPAALLAEEVLRNWE